MSIHDVSPRHEGAVDRLRERLADHGGPVAMLVVPDFWGEAPIRAGSPFATRLRNWAEAGTEMFLHGLRHRDDTVHRGWAARLKARQMTAGEGEFLGLDADEAMRRIVSGRALLEDITGRAVAGFIAPAWLYGQGAHTAMQATQMPLAEDHWKVWVPATGQTLARSPVITWATRTPARALSSRMFAAIARAAPKPRVVRIGVHPGDVSLSSTLTSITHTIDAVGKTHVASRYDDLIRDAA